MKKYLFILILFFSINKIQSQPIVLKYVGIEKLAKSTLYVVIDPKRDDDQKYADLITEIWKYSKIEVIEYEEIYNHINSNSFFLTQNVTYYKNKTTYSKETDRLQEFKLVIWGFTRTFLKDYKKNPQNYKNSNLFDYSWYCLSIELTPDISKTFTIDKVFSSDYMGKDYLCTYGEGLLKNYIQCLQNILIEKKYPDFHFRSYYNRNELKKLSNSTLYIPEYIIKENKNKKIKEEYPYKYEIISMDDLNELILNSKTPIYYLTSYRYSVKRFRKRTAFNITKSDTGEIVFSNFVRKKSTYPPKLMKILVEKIDYSLM